MTGEDTRALVTEVQRTGLRGDTGPRLAAAPEGGTHFATLVKPEVLTTTGAVEAMSEVLRVLGEGDVQILRCAMVPARDFGARGALLLHYPRLHRVAADGAQALCSRARRELLALHASFGTAGAIGAYEAMTYDTDLTPVALGDRCRESGIHRLGSGSYASVIELAGGPTTVLNGFLPALASTYNDPTALVGLLECHSHREIDDLRTHLLGALHPAAAAPTTLRGALGALTGGQRGESLSEGRNGVHLSAGHLEGMFQVWRYFAATDGRGIDSTALGRSLVERGVSMASVAALAADHNLAEDSGETVAPHGATENLHRTEVLDRVHQWTVTGKGFQA